MTEENENEEEGPEGLISKLGDEVVDSASKEGKKTLNQILGVYAEYFAYKWGKLGEVISATEKLRSDTASEEDPDDVTPAPIELVSPTLEKLGTTADDVLEDVHPNHLSFALGTYLIEFDDFLEAIAELKPEDRDALFDHVYHEVIHPEYRPEDGKTMAECFHPRVNYENFRNQVWSRDYHCAPHNVHQWVVTALNLACHMGKASNLQTVKLKQASSLENLQKLQDHAESDKEKDLIASLLQTHDKLHGTDSDIENRFKENADRYARVCEELVPKLITASEKPISYDAEEIREIADTLRVISDRAKSD